MSKKIIITVDTATDDGDVSGCAVLLGITTIVVGGCAVGFAAFVFMAAAVGGGL